ncbi:cupin domain-containing protein [Candidatus Chloroploca sp. Khr17]|uniref:cupin domain-containing protein n=1 Tax=Candidatus Chloroploca sp. Khr17 TaxID=2496869 RepID=UPI0013ED569F|nr:cupin domain-containing protein [Candidatus Chloroploca sp. Khr17]
MSFDPEYMVDVAEALRHAAYDGAIWSLNCEQLNVNLMRLMTGAGIPEHRNDELDVLLVVFEGSGELQLDDQRLALEPGLALVIPRGARRAIRCLRGPLAYLMAHRQRGALLPR